MCKGSRAFCFHFKRPLLGMRKWAPTAHVHKQRRTHIRSPGEKDGASTAVAAVSQGPRGGRRNSMSVSRVQKHLESSTPHTLSVLYIVSRQVKLLASIIHAN